MDLRWKGKSLPLQANSWYNLSTKRYITTIQGLHNLYSVYSVAVVGSYADIYQFWQENYNLFVEYNYLGSRAEDYIYKPTEDVNFLVRQASQSPPVGQLSTVCTTNVNHLTDSQLNSLSVFTLANQFLKCKITKLLDGDTFQGVIYLPLQTLGTSLNNQCPALVNIPSKKGLFNRETPDSGMFIKVVCRMYAYDAMEINTPEGKIALDEMHRILTSYLYTVWLYFINQTDKYGRQLVIMYTDQSRNLHLNNYLITRGLELGKVLAKPYIGGTK